MRNFFADVLDLALPILNLTCFGFIWIGPAVYFSMEYDSAWFFFLLVPTAMIGAFFIVLFAMLTDKVVGAVKA